MSPENSTNATPPKMKSRPVRNNEGLSKIQGECPKNNISSG
jgi:hypothetical protein